MISISLILIHTCSTSLLENLSEKVLEMGLINFSLQ
jgi:hypothetical protein